MTTTSKTFTIKEVALLIKCSESAIIKAISKAKKENQKSIRVKNHVYYFASDENKRGYIFSKSEFIFNTDVNIDIKVDIDTEIEDLNLNIKINGIKVN
jgi:hypothetical protein